MAQHRDQNALRDQSVSSQHRAPRSEYDRQLLLEWTSQPTLPDTFVPLIVIGRTSEGGRFSMKAVHGHTIAAKPLVTAPRQEKQGEGILPLAILERSVLLMRPTLSHLCPRRTRSFLAILLTVAVLLLGGQGAMADGSSVSGNDSAPGATPLPSATPAADASLMEQLPGDEDVALVVGVAAVTVMGLAGLAMLDRRPDVTEIDSQSEHLPDER